MALFDIFGIGSSADYLSGFMSEEERRKLQERAGQNALLQSGLAMLANSGYSRTPVSLGQILGAGGQAGMQAYQGTLDQGASNVIMQQKLADMKRQRDIQAKQDLFRASIGQPNAERQVAIPPETAYQPMPAQEGAVAPNFNVQPSPVQYKTEQYFDPDKMMQQALQSGALEFKDYLSLVAKDKKDSPFAKIDPKDYTKESFAAYVRTGDITQLTPLDKSKESTSGIQEYNFAVGQGYKGSFEDWKKLNKQEGVTVNYGTPVAAVDSQGNPVFIQPSKSGGAPSVIPGYAPPPQKIGEATQKQVTGINNLRQAIQDYKAELATWNPNKDVIDPAKRAKMSTTYNNMMLQAKEAYGLGVLNGPDYSILTSTIADPTSLKGAAYGVYGSATGTNPLKSQADALDKLMGSMKKTIEQSQPGARRQEQTQEQPSKPQKKNFEVSGKKYEAELGADGNYYVTVKGKRYRVEE